MKEVVLGIDIGGTNTKFGWIERDGNILFQENIITQDFVRFNDLIDCIFHVSQTMISSISDSLILRGIGIGAPNGNYYKGTIEFAPNLPWEGVIPITDITEKKFGLPAFLTNDANAAAIGEMIYGGAKGMKDFVVITLGTGLGSGFVVNGNVMYGHDGFAGELGHITVDPNGRICGCGRKGCLETYASAGGICTTVKELLKKPSAESSVLSAISTTMNSKDITIAATAGDAIALEAFDLLSKTLGSKLADMVSITSPEAIFLFGGLAKAGDLLLIPVKKYMEENLLKIFRNKVSVLPSQLPGDDAAILGASALAWKEIELHKKQE